MALGVDFVAAPRFSRTYRIVYQELPLWGSEGSSGVNAGSSVRGVRRIDPPIN